MLNEDLLPLLRANDDLLPLLREKMKKVSN